MRKSTFSAIGSSILLFACDMDFEPSLLEESRILAARAAIDAENPSLMTLETLTHEVDSLRMTVCAAPWLPTEDGVECLTPNWELPVDAETLSSSLDLSQVSLPPELLAYSQSLYIKIDSITSDVVPSIFELSLISNPENPKMTGILLDGSLPTEWAASDLDSVEVSTEWENPDDALDTSISFYTNSGSFSPWRTADGGSSSWTPNPEGDGSTTLYVIARKLGLGATWTTVEIVP